MPTVDRHSPMAANSLDAAPEGDVSSTPSFACPFCGTTYYVRKLACSRCDGNLVVPIEDEWVYEEILPLCGNLDDV